MRLRSGKRNGLLALLITSATLTPSVAADGLFSSPMLAVRGAVADFLGTSHQFQKMQKRQNAPDVNTATFQTPSMAAEPSLHAPGTETDVVGNAQSIGMVTNSGERGTPPATTNEGIGFANPLTEANPTNTLAGQTGGVYDDSNIGTVQSSLANAISTGNAVANAVSASVATGEQTGAGMAIHSASQAQGLDGPSAVAIGLTTIGGNVFPVSGTSVITASGAFSLQAPSGQSLCSGGAIYGTLTLCPSAAGARSAYFGTVGGSLDVVVSFGIASFLALISALLFL